MSAATRGLLLSFLGTTGLAAELWSQAVRRAPVNPNIARSPMTVPRHTVDLTGRYEYFDPASGVLWAIVLNPEGTAEILVNGKAALTTTGELQTFRYRVTGTSLFMWDSGSHREELYGSFADSTLTTIAGWRFKKRS
ncbi:MAG TPA: hypothetical protein VEU55_08175 [Gemmatimonadales bacterium]|nr:hypothetical protein [Gemmatimonadales bacterium]